MTVKVRDEFSERVRVIAKNTGIPSRTKQASKDECDVNNIVKKYTQSGVLTHVRMSQPQYGDFTQVADYQTALNAVMQAQETFSQLPPKIRARFGNDPGQFLEFMEDPKNDAESRHLGLRPKKLPEGGSNQRKAIIDAQPSTPSQTPPISAPNAVKDHANA